MTTSRTGTRGATPTAPPPLGDGAPVSAAPDSGPATPGTAAAGTRAAGTRAAGTRAAGTRAAGTRAARGPDVDGVAAPAPGGGRSPARRARDRGDAGMTTAEYAVGTVAACGFAAVLYKVVTSDAVARLLRGVLEQAFSASPL